VGGDADILTHMFGLLVDGRSPAEVSELLQRAQGLIDVTSQSIKQREALESRMSAVIIFLERGLPGNCTTTLQPRQRLMLTQAAEVCQEIVGTTCFDDYWRFVAASLLAECIYLLGERTTALQHAEVAQQMLPLTMPPTPTTEACAAYTQHMLRQTSELPVTSHSFLEQLQQELSSM
jgi:hypothetical protein